jgi:crossover junction endodeoxyribonuclease RusA
MTTYRLELPYQRPPSALTGNTRSHWRSRSSQARAVRTDVAMLARSAGIPKAEHLTVELVWSPGDRRRRDADNLWPLLKVACDALARGRADWVGLELVPDDTPAFMTKRAPRIAGPDESGECGMWLYVTTADPSRPVLTLKTPQTRPQTPGGAL